MNFNFLLVFIGYDSCTFKVPVIELWAFYIWRPFVLQIVKDKLFNKADHGINIGVKNGKSMCYAEDEN